jgi:hypothetical protein
MCFNPACEGRFFFQTARDALDKIRQLLEQDISVLAVNLVLTPTASLQRFHPLRILKDRALHPIGFNDFILQVRAEVVAVIEVGTPMFIPFRNRNSEGCPAGV